MAGRGTEVCCPFTDVPNTTLDANLTAPVSNNMATFKHIALRSVYMTIGAVGFLGNTLVLLVIFNNSTMRKKLTSLYLINQSLIDLVAALLVFAMGVLDHSGAGMTSGYFVDELICCIWLTRAPLWSMLMSSTWNLQLLTVERYWEVVHPIAHKTRFSRSKALLGIVFVWVFGPVYNLAYEVPTSRIVDGVCYPFTFWPSDTVQVFVGVCTVLLQYVIPLCVMTFCYSRMALALRKKISPDPASGGRAAQQSRYERARRNVIKTLFVVSVCFVLCWTSNEVFILMYFLGYPADFAGPLYHLTVVAVFVNCCVNPIVYTAKYEEFQRGLRRLVCHKLLKRSPGSARSGASIGNSTVAIDSTD